MAIAPPPPAWVQWVSMLSGVGALVILVRVSMWIGDIRRQVHTMWESWLFEHAHITPPETRRRGAAKQGNLRS